MKMEQQDVRCHININDLRHIFTTLFQTTSHFTEYITHDMKIHTENVGCRSYSKLSPMSLGSHSCSLHSSCLEFVVVLRKGCRVACVSESPESRSGSKTHDIAIIFRINGRRQLTRRHTRHDTCHTHSHMTCRAN